MALTPQDVQHKQFTPTRFKTGYDEDEVDAFLDEVEAEITLLHDRIAALEGELAEARLAPVPPSEVVHADGYGDTPALLPSYVQPEPVPDVAPAPAADLPPVTQDQREMEEMMRRTLLLAQRTADEAVREAREEAARIVSDARARAETEEHDAGVRLTVVMRARELDRQRLEAQVETLRAFEGEYRTRLRAYLQMQLRDLELTQAPQGTTGVSPVEAGTPRPPDPPAPAS